MEDFVETCGRALKKCARLDFHVPCSSQHLYKDKDNLWNGDNLVKSEWVQEATDEVHNGITRNKVPGTSTKERLAVVNHVFHSLARIDDSSKESLEYIKQKASKEFQTTIGTGGKTTKELCARRNEIARSL